MLRCRTTLLALAALLAAACSSEGPLVVEGDSAAGGGGGNGGGNGIGIGTPSPAPVDSAAPGPLPSSVRAYGTTYRVTVTPGSADSLRHVPLAGVRITLLRNVIENGVGVSKLERELTSDAAGNWAVSGLAGGYYIVKATAEGMGESWEYLAGTKEEVRVNLYLWPKR